MHLISNTLNKQIAQPPSPPTQVLVNLRWCGCACSLRSTHEERLLIAFCLAHTDGFWRQGPGPSRFEVY